MGTSPLLGSGSADSSAGLPRNRVVKERTRTVERRHRGIHRSNSVLLQGSGSADSSAGSPRDRVVKESSRSAGHFCFRKLRCL
ncbi:hypothetical protein AVEN_82217-1, partial [Araneus ventricosus]